MSDFTSVNSAAMTTGIDALQSAYNQLRSALDTLEGELKSSLAQWDGAAQETYYRVQREWNEDCTQMAAVIQSAREVLGQIQQGYADTENKITATFGG